MPRQEPTVSTPPTATKKRRQRAPDTDGACCSRTLDVGDAPTTPPTTTSDASKEKLQSDKILSLVRQSYLTPLSVEQTRGKMTQVLMHGMLEQLGASMIEDLRGKSMRETSAAAAAAVETKMAAAAAMRPEVAEALRVLAMAMASERAGTLERDFFMSKSTTATQALVGDDIPSDTLLSDQRCVYTILRKLQGILAHHPYFPPADGTKRKASELLEKGRERLRRRMNEDIASVVVQNTQTSGALSARKRELEAKLDASRGEEMLLRERGLEMQKQEEEIEQNSKYFNEVPTLIEFFFVVDNNNNNNDAGQALEKLMQSIAGSVFMEDGTKRNMLVNLKHSLVDKSDGVTTMALEEVEPAKRKFETTKADLEAEMEAMTSELAAVDAQLQGAENPEALRRFIELDVYAKMEPLLSLVMLKTFMQDLMGLPEVLRESRMVILMRVHRAFEASAFAHPAPGVAADA